MELVFFLYKYISITFLQALESFIV